MFVSVVDVKFPTWLAVGFAIWIGWVLLVEMYFERVSGFFSE